MKRAIKIQLIILGIIITLFIVSFKIDNQLKIYIPLTVIFIGMLVLRIIEFKYIDNKIKLYFENKNYNDAIEYLNYKVDKSFIYINAYSCTIPLVIFYMLEGDIEQSKYLIEKYKRIKKNKNLFFVQMIILIAENRLKEAKMFQEKLLNINSIKYQAQKDSSIKIFNMIESKLFDEDLYNNTKYPLLKTICLRYKNNDIDKTENIEINK